MSDDIAIKVEHVSKSFRLPHNKQSSIKGTLINFFGGDRTYETQKVLKDVSFEIKKGEFFGIVGRNGSGKSTLLKMLAGIYTPTKGNITVNGSLTPFIELGVGFNPELTGRENVYLNGALLGFNNKEISIMYKDIVDFAELERFMDQKLKNYSSGMQVRLAFSIAIRANSDILLLDEVLAVGDAAFQQKCFDYFEKLRSEKQTVIIVTHDMNAVKRFCSRAMMISGGSIQKTGTPETIAEMYTEDNIEQTDNLAAGSVLEYELVGDKRIYDSTDILRLRARFTGVPETVFVNFSLSYNGFVVADKNSKHNDEKNQMKAGEWIEFITPLAQLNGGKYDIHLSLHRKNDDKLIEHVPRAFSFLIKGHDPSRDGPVCLDGDWLPVKKGKNK